MLKKNMRGDTLIEVLIAVSVFSLIAVGGLSIMNQGTIIAQRALEVTLVRQEIDAQAETLRFLNASYISAYQTGLSSTDYDFNLPASQWRALSNLVSTSDPISSFSVGNKCPTLALMRANSFVFNTKTVTRIPLAADKFRAAQTFSQLRYNVSGNVVNIDGLWVEAIKKIEPNNNQNNADYIDFHIRACWDGPGSSAPITLGTIVRLYEPR